MIRCLLVLFLLVPAIAVAQAAPAAASSAAAPPRVLVKTSVGDITLELYPDKAPRTVANFLAYVQQGFYAGTVFHRVIKGFLIQGGIYDRELKERRTQPAIPDEADNGLSNLRGTIAAARAPDVTQSATSQFFINLVANRRLDFVSNRNGLTAGYAVFGKVIQGMDVVDKIGALPTMALGPFTGDVPEPLVVIESATLIQPQPATATSTP
ncbi:MAG TPA: peptidylprolyl isomerase [Rhodanobacteraceae bacterium]|nr:peptidylprolyl isomerase [Rhodanobacteraceae bacterium]